MIKLKELERESRKRGIPIVGPNKGAFLFKKVKEVKPKKILELGTANGYSGCILGSEGGNLYTVEIDEKIAIEARQNFKKNGIEAEIITGDGVKVVEDMAFQKEHKESFEIIFVDFVKSQYIRVLEPCLALLKKGGFIIADNITFSGCRDYKKAVISDDRLQTEIIDIEDGLASSMKL